MTICLDGFQRIASKEIQKYNCSDTQWGSTAIDINYFFQTLYYCVDEGMLETTTTEANVFGGLFGSHNYYGESFEVSKFATLDELYHSIKLDISDILHGFRFGNLIHMTKGNRIQILKEDWAEKLHYDYGFCYTFDPKKLSKHLTPTMTNRLNSI